MLKRWEMSHLFILSSWFFVRNHVLHAQIIAGLVMVLHTLCLVSNDILFDVRMCCSTPFILLTADTLASISIFLTALFIILTPLLQHSQSYAFFFRPLLLLNLADLPLSPSQYIWFSVRLSFGQLSLLLFPNVAWRLLSGFLTYIICVCQTLMVVTKYGHLCVCYFFLLWLPKLNLPGTPLICHFYRLLCFLNTWWSFLLDLPVSLGFTNFSWFYKVHFY